MNHLSPEEFKVMQAKFTLIEVDETAFNTESWGFDPSNHYGEDITKNQHI